MAKKRSTERRGRGGRRPVHIPTGGEFVKHIRRKILDIESGAPGPEMDYFRTREVAAMFGVSLRTVQWWITTGKLRCAATGGGHSRVTYDDLLRFIEEQGVYNPLGRFVNFRLLLIVEEREIRRIQPALRRRKELNVHEATDPYAGLVDAGRLRPDFILLGARGRDVDWPRYIRSLKTHGIPPSIAVVVHDPRARKGIREAGPDVLYEPNFKPSEFLGFIAEREREMLSRPATVQLRAAQATPPA